MSLTSITLNYNADEEVPSFSVRQEGDESQVEVVISQHDHEVRLYFSRRDALEIMQELQFALVEALTHEV